MKASILTAAALCALGGCASVVQFEGRSKIAIKAAPPAAEPEAPKRVELQKDKIVINEKIQFALNEAVILDTSFGLLDEVAGVIQKNAQIKKLQIEGHASSEGNPIRNKNLSRQRAEAVMKYLVGKGVAKGRLMARGFGSEKPIASNDDEAGREKNRRVEFNIVEQEAPPAGASGGK